MISAHAVVARPNPEGADGKTDPGMEPRTDIAIVGMSCIFPGAENLDAFWKNILNKVDSIGPVPTHRLDAVYFDQTTAGVDRFYCRRGGFIPDVHFDPLRFGILPVAVEGMEPEQLITLDLVQQALDDAGVFEKKMALDKAGIIIGKGNYAGPGATRAIEIIRTGEQIVSLLKTLLPHLEATDLERVKKEFQQEKGRFGADTAMGLIPNLVASLVANRLNLGGAAYTVDAACASSLLAVDHAVQELRSQRCDLVVAGGVHVGQNAAFWSIFTQLGALSREETIRPFDQRADGLVIGEGCGFVVLKRLDDAIAAADRIYAVVKGVGISSDGSGTSVMNPSVQGQARAIRQAWDQAGLDRRDVGYIEAHGTGTPIGDKTELETLAQLFGVDASVPKAGIGSVKSNIGHAMPAAGIAGLIKTALALHHNTLPPTLHCAQPLEQLGLTRFAPVQEARNWEESGLPKRAGINAFGFGGINAHVVLEGFISQKTTPEKTVFLGKTDEVLLLARPSQEALLQALETGDKNPGTGSHRLAVFDPTPERIGKAQKVVTRGLPWRNRQDIWYTNEPLLSGGGKIAFVFPGLDGLSSGEVASVAEYFNLSAYVEGEETEELLDKGLKLLANSKILDTALKQAGIQPDMNAGHSLGEWLAVRSSGLAEEASILHLLSCVGSKSVELTESRFIAVGCGLDRVEPLLAQIEDLYLSNDNCPQQVLLCGTDAALEQLVPILKKEQLFHQVLPFQSGFHSPFVKDKLDVLLAGLDTVKFRKPHIPIWSATTLAHYPEGMEAIRALCIEHLVKPVRFRELTEKLYDEGARVFIQVGSGSLVGFIDDTLRGKSYSAVAANGPLRSGITQVQRILAALFVEGKETGMAVLGYPKTKSVPVSHPLTLQLGSPFVTAFTSLNRLSERAPAPQYHREVSLDEVAHPVMKAFAANLDEMAHVQSELVHLFQNRGTPLPLVAPTATVRRRSFSKPLDISLANNPYLIDHALVRQPPGWTCAADMDTVIPMTMIFELFAEIALEQAPGETVQKILNMKVFQWMDAAKPFQETVVGEWKTPALVRLNIERFASTDVLVSKQWAPPPKVQPDLGPLLNLSLTPAQIYAENMFHGPAYQGIKEVKAIGEKGIIGTIEGASGKGSLLDNAGQLFGLWLQFILQKNRVAFPVKIQEIEFFDDFQQQDGPFECTCVLTELTDEFATGTITLKREGKVWAQLTGWQNHRLEIDGPLWRMALSPLANRLSEEIAPGVFLFYNAYTRVTSWDFILKRYFNQTEKKHHNSLLPNKQKEWIISRVAVKDAVRAVLEKTKSETCFPIEFELKSDANQKPYVEGSLTSGIHISLAHKKTHAVGIATYDKPVGIDIERIEERSEGFQELAFSRHERQLLADKDQVEWPTRFWVAKEAYGKSLGVGLSGNPKTHCVEEIIGDTLRIQNTIIKTIKHENFIIGWTL